MCVKSNIDIEDKSGTKCNFNFYRVENGCRHCRQGTTSNSNFDYLCVKTNIGIVDKSSKRTSQTGELLEINLDNVDNTFSPKFKVNLASATSISTAKTNVDIVDKQLPQT